MIAAASASYGAAPSCSTSKKQQEGEEQPSAGVKNVLNRVLSRRLSSYNINKKSTPAAQAEPTPPPSRQQQQPPMQMQMPMQPSIRRRPQLHNPQNTLRATSTLVNNPQNQGDIDNGHVVAPLPGLDEDSQLQLPPTIRRPSTAPGVKVAALAKGTTSSSAGQPATEGTGLFGRLVRRRPAPKERDTENDKKRGSSASIGDNSNEPSGVDDQNRSSTDPVPVMNETTEHYQMQPQSLPLNPSAHRTLDAPSSAPRSETVSDAQTTSKSSVPRFLRQVAKPRQASVAMTQTATAQKSKSHSHLRPSQQPAPSSTTQPKLRPKRSFGKRFWSRPGANDFDDDHQVAKTEAPPLPSVPSVPPTVYVPKHAAVDFSRTINPRLNRQSLIVGDDQVNDLRPTTADTRVGESETQPRQRALASATIDKHMARDLSMSKYEAPSPMELHRRLEILKRREAEAVAKTRNPWQHQLNLLQTNANTSASNMKAPILKGPSRSISSRRHSFSLISDPHARELTPPRSASPAETEAPIDPPSQMPQQMVSAVAPGVTSSHDHTHQTRQDGPVKQAAARQMTDFERFLAEAEVAERERQAQMWRNLARRSGHYGYSDNPWNPVRPVDPSLIGTSAVNAAANRNNKRNSAQYTVDKRASMMSDFYGPLTGTYGSSGDDADATRGLGRQGSVSKRISQYIKPPKPSAQPTYEDWPTGRANRRSAIVGAIGE
ncbi:uncharacterized protein GLRG_08880 [Colletotrichum graminicola M1.001]|uniref:Uncharacterized protein n=1 Tax=Colletotrichum graminicola (strain M1.001 / M2 / FGSC 10212) TaxID=645133 RepID=E3QSA9_COLGM|nr:uncharacterized protein GLRG_08880 [Colletotrichum graminicola M1.001]EFQ33736.1 hypothetical protein GLRG_08880 [Colletotrichum graminicola M1.001]